MNKLSDVITKDPCFYCDDDAELGIDRIDNNIGYVLDNYCSCCISCNVAKGEMTQEEFLKLMRKITAYQASRI